MYNQYFRIMYDSQYLNAALGPWFADLKLSVSSLLDVSGLA
jgi:hypothetical protein